ncbi:MAG: hypothetical protein ACKV2T_23595 [Kofleriaceae bacterium]
MLDRRGTRRAIERAANVQRLAIERRAICFGMPLGANDATIIEHRTFVERWPTP